MKYIATAIALLLLAACTPAPAPSPEPVPIRAIAERDFIRLAYSATALLFMQNEQGDMGQVCTATVIDRTPTGYLAVTAAHCTSREDAAHVGVALKPLTFYVTFDESDPKRLMRARVVAVGYQHRGDDFAIVEFKSADEIPLMPLGDESQESIGAEILNVASPMGLGRQAFRGFISLLRLDRPVIEDGVNWQNAMLLQLDVGSGASGSAVFSFKQRAIVAFLVGAIESGKHPSAVAIPVSRFKAFREMVAAGKYKWFAPSE